MTSNVVNSTRIELLTQSNYNTWKVHAEALLIKSDLWDYVSGDIPKPAVGTGDQKAACDLKIKTWQTNDRKAKADLLLSIHPDELQNVIGCETSRDVWIKLEEVYAPNQPIRIATLLKQLIFQRLEENGCVRDHLKSFFASVNKLSALKIEMHPSVLSVLLLYSLPSSYENFRCAMESRDELPKPEALKVKIMEEDTVRRHNLNTVVGDGAVAAGRRNWKPPNQSKKDTSNKILEKQGKQKFRCFRCGRIGHKANVCPAKNNKQYDRKSDANAVDDESFATCLEAIDELNFEDLTTVKTKPWILDSGCTSHLCKDRNSFDKFDTNMTGMLKLASNSSTEVKGNGNVKILLPERERIKRITFENTLYVPDLRNNLISVSKITNKGYNVIFDEKSARVVDKEGLVHLEAQRKGDLYYVGEKEPINMSHGTANADDSDLNTWHRRLGHLNNVDLMKIMKKAKCKVPISDSKDLINCEVCIQGKMTRKPFPTGRSPRNTLLEVVHSDVVGPIRIRSMNQEKYFITFVDDASRWCEVYLLGQKSGALTAFKMYKNRIENLAGNRIKSLQTDNGLEYCNAEFNKYLQDCGIERRLTVPHTPQQNGVAERINRTLLDMARCLMLDAGLPQMFWACAITAACHIRNRCPSKIIGGLTPYEKLKGKIPKFNYMKVFGSEVYVLDKSPAKGKFDPRSKKGIFVGYPREVKGYRVWMPKEKKIIIARDVKFLELRKSSYNDRKSVDIFNLPSIAEIEEKQKGTEMRSIELTRKASTPTMKPKSPNSDVETPVKGRSRTSNEDPLQASARGRGRPRLLRTGSRGRPRKIFQTVRGQENEDALDLETETELEDDVFAGAIETPLQEAIASPEWNEWQDAILSEMISLLKNDVFEIVKTDSKQKLVSNRLVLTKKFKPDGSIDKFKARLVAKGFSQQYGVNYHDTFAPVARLESLRLVMALAAEYNLKVHQLDIVTAYLNGKLDEEVLMKPPEMIVRMLELISNNNQLDSGIIQRAKKILNKIKDGGNACKLKKALYGLKQGGRQWFNTLNQKLKELGFSPTKGEPCLYISHRKKDVMLILTYVDDLLIASSSNSWISEVKRGLCCSFEVKDLGLAKFCLGIEIDQTEDHILLSQKGYICELLRRFGMDACNSVTTPAEVNPKYESTEMIDERNYKEIIGALLYLSTGTRPDIGNVVSRLAQYSNAPTKDHWVASKRVLRYLSGTKDLGLKYCHTGNNPIVGFADADWGSNLLDRRSFTGYCFMMAGSVISWKSQKQRTVALSSTEAEYICLAEAAKEAVYLRNLLLRIQLMTVDQITIFTDNRGAQCLSSDPKYHSRTKHIDIRHHFIRDLVNEGVIDVKHQPTTEMPADILTKALPRTKHKWCVEAMGMAFKPATDNNQHSD